MTYAYRASGGTTWTTEVIDATGRFAANIAATSDGIPHVLYYTGSEIGMRCGPARTSGPAKPWSPPPARVLAVWSSRRTVPYMPSSWTVARPSTTARSAPGPGPMA